jgi:hypothetical protein
MGSLHEGQKVWVEQADGSQRPGIFVGEEVAAMRVVPRDDGE